MPVCTYVYFSMSDDSGNETDDINNTLYDLIPKEMNGHVFNIRQNDLVNSDQVDNSSGQLCFLPNYTPYIFQPLNDDLYPGRLMICPFIFKVGWSLTYTSSP
jgi:hypothetical protein